MTVELNVSGLGKARGTYVNVNLPVKQHGGDRYDGDIAATAIPSAASTSSYEVPRVAEAVLDALVHGHFEAGCRAAHAALPERLSRHVLGRRRDVGRTLCAAAAFRFHDSFEVTGSIWNL